MSQRSFSRSHRRRLLAQARRDELRRRVGLATGAALGASALLASAAQADTFTVTTTADAAATNCLPAACTLRDAVAAANANTGADTITFASGLTGTIRLTEGQLTLTEAATTITGPGSQVLALSGDKNDSGVADTGDSRILEVRSGASLTLSGLELTRGFGSAIGSGKYATGGGGGILVRSGASATVRDAALTRNDAGPSGGPSRADGGAILSGGTLSVERSTLSGNTAAGSGGAIARTNELVSAPGNKYTSLPIGPATVSGSVLSENSADAGGGFAAFSGKYASGSAPALAPSADDVVISGSTISQNTANRGGGVVVTQLGPAPVTETSERPSGAGRAATSATTRILDTSITQNTSTRDAGAARLEAGEDASIVVQRTTITGNTADGDGGGLYGEAHDSGSLTVDGGTIADNRATGGDGGGVFVSNVDADASIAVADSTISGNTATDGEGGGLKAPAVAGSLTLAQSTLTGNSARLGGGAAFADSDGGVRRPAPGQEIELRGSTIAGNTATEEGGGIELGRIRTQTSYDPDTEESTYAFSSARLPLTSTVVAQNTAAGEPNDLGQQPLDDESGDGFVLSHSLIQTPGDVPKTTDPAAPSRFGVDPQLGSLADNGGPTKTLLPAATSALLDAGKADAGVTTDQRGAARTVDLTDAANATGSDATDIGAVERGAPVPPAQNPAPPVAAQPAQPVAPAPAVKPGPSSAFRVTSRPAKPKAGKQPIILRGTAAKGTRKVRVAVGYKTGSKCQFLLKNGKFSARRDCRRTLYVTAKGTRKWTLKLPTLRKGRYTIWSRAISAGQVERKMTDRNFQRLRIR